MMKSSANIALRKKVAYHLDALQIMGENDMGDLPEQIAASFHNAVGHLSDVLDWLQRNDKEQS
jgi:hypothetical protein